jgi:hypothetical protein
MRSVSPKFIAQPPNKFSTTTKTVSLVTNAVSDVLALMPKVAPQAVADFLKDFLNIVELAKGGVDGGIRRYLPRYTCGRVHLWRAIDVNYTAR